MTIEPQPNFDVLPLWVQIMVFAISGLSFRMRRYFGGLRLVIKTVHGLRTKEL